MIFIIQQEKQGSDYYYYNHIQTCRFSQFSRSVMSDSLRLHEPQHSRPPYHHQLLESTQTHIHWVGDAIQPSHPLSSPSSPALNLSQHQGLFKCQLFTSGGQNIGVFQLIQDWFWLPDAKSELIGKDPEAAKYWGQEKKGMTEDEMVGWHHWLNGHEFG